MNLCDEIAERVDKLSPDLQEQVLRFVASIELSVPKGESGAALQKFSGSLDQVSAREMSRATEEECELVDALEW